MRRIARISPLLLISACVSTPEPDKATAKPTPKDAQQFAKKLNADLKALYMTSSEADWAKSTNITPETEAAAAKATEKLLAYTSDAIKEAAEYDAVRKDADTTRFLHLLKISSSAPPPAEPAKQRALAEILAKLEGMYGRGKYCPSKDECKDLGELSDIIGKSRDYDALLDAWTGWRTVSPPMQPMYTRFVELANDGARSIGFKDVAELWRAKYDMPGDAFEADVDRLWSEVQPLYNQLHCYVRGRLAKQYGEDKVSKDGAIPAHLLGNMWAQDWSNVYSMVEPYPGQASLDVTTALQQKRYDPIKLTQLSERFFTSMGLRPLPASFWEKSMFTKPDDREVVCHASAWDMDFGGGDLRIKMCIKIDEEDMTTLHHELGHIYYFMYYNELPMLYQNGAHDGFHEAIGDAVTLSITPGYLTEVGILEGVQRSPEALINLQLKWALSQVAFLPFGRLIDQWRWDVFAGKVQPAQYNDHWWQLREKYQGVRAPAPRPADAFDPGAKYHIPANVSYIRYFLAGVLKFQFYEAMCKSAGHQGPLHECSVYGNQDAGKALAAMLEMGASKPWPDALEAMTGSRQMSAEPLKRYFAPLEKWLKEQNAGLQCGW